MELRKPRRVQSGRKRIAPFAPGFAMIDEKALTNHRRQGAFHEMRFPSIDIVAQHEDIAHQLRRIHDEHPPAEQMQWNTFGLIAAGEKAAQDIAAQQPDHFERPRQAFTRFRKGGDEGYCGHNNAEYRRAARLLRNLIQPAPPAPAISA